MMHDKVTKSTGLNPMAVLLGGCPPIGGRGTVTKNGEKKMDYEEWKKEYDEREFTRQTEISSLDDYPVCVKNRISVVKGALGEIFPHGDKRTMITGILNQPVYQKRGKHYWMKTDANSHGLEAVYCLCSDCDMGLWVERSIAEELPDIEEVWPDFNE